MRRRNRFLGHWLRHGEGYPDWSTRLFNRRNAAWSDDPVHEKVLYAVTPGSLEGDLLHESAEDLANYLQKQNRYSSLAAQQLSSRAQGRRAAAHPVAIGALYEVLRPAPRLPRRITRPRAHIDRLRRELHEVREADRAERMRRAR
jgi:hypothetical protein